jgi:hypothetical protein
VAGKAEHHRGQPDITVGVGGNLFTPALQPSQIDGRRTAWKWTSIFCPTHLPKPRRR